MLDIDTLNALDDLMARTLYHAEVARLPTLTRAEEQELVTRARSGDIEARAALVVSCLHYTLGKAHHLYTTRRPVHDDEMDLVQVASLEMLSGLDRALTKRNPVPYLRKIGALCMSVHLTYFSGFIRKPKESLETLEKMNIPVVESLDIPASRNSARLKMDIIEVAPLPDEQPEQDAEKREAQHAKRFAPLYEALNQLTPRQRSMVIKRYRLDIAGEPTDERGVPPEAMWKLRKALQGHLKQMLSPEQEE